MIKKCRPLIVVSVTAVFLLVTFAGNALWANLVKRNRVEHTFTNMPIGGSKEELVKKLGAPDEIDFCGKPDTANTSNHACDEKYWYKVFISRWGFSFDKNGTVINKTNNVSY